MTGTVTSVNVSESKGTIKTPAASVRVTPYGIEGDAHAGSWHRQISLLAGETVAAMSRESGRSFAAGEFAENITTAGIDLDQVALRDQLKIGAVRMEITQIGKTCHGTGCTIFREVGKCAMPKKGIFARVLQEGEMRPGDRIEHLPCPLRAQIITLSDRAFRGEYEDRSGPAIRDVLQRHCRDSRWRLEVGMTLLPDDPEKLQAALRQAVAQPADIVITTGGTGIGPRDRTPEAVRPLLEKEIPGLMEFIRVKYGATLPAALLSRSVAGVIGPTLVYVLPGSVRAIQDYMSEILKTLDHTLRMLWGLDAH